MHHVAPCFQGTSGVTTAPIATVHRPALWRPWFNDLMVAGKCRIRRRQGSFATTFWDQSCDCSKALVEVGQLDNVGKVHIMSLQQLRNEGQGRSATPAAKSSKPQVTQHHTTRTSWMKYLGMAHVLDKLCKLRCCKGNSQVP